MHERLDWRSMIRDRMRGTTLLGLAIVVPLGCLARPASSQPAAEVRVDAESVQRRTIAATSVPQKAAPAALEAESLLVEVPLPSGKRYPGELTLVREPRSGLFWWHFRGADASTPADRLGDVAARFAFYVSDDELVGIETAAPPPSLWCLRSTARTASLDDGRRIVLRTLARNAAALEKGTARWQRSVSLWKALPHDFYYQPLHAAPRLELAVRSIARADGGWEVGLEGREGQRARVVLDDLFNLVEAEVLGGG